MLTPQEVRQLSQPSAWRTWTAVMVDWSLITVIFVVAARFPHPLVILAAMFIMARQQLALLVLMHDASHRRLFKSPLWNDLVSQVLCSAPMFFSMYSYKHSHLKHHLAPLVAEDPDLGLTGGYPIERGSFFRKLSRDLLGISYFKFIKYFVYMSRKRRAGAPGVKTVIHVTRSSTDQMSVTQVATSIVLTNLLLFLALLLAGHPWLYLFLWVMPTMTVLQLYLRIRGITEHAGYKPNENQMLNSRTVVNPLQTFFVAPHGVNYHIEHHAFPSIPYFRLAKAHRMLKERGALPAANLYQGYGEVIRQLVIARK